MQCSDKAVMWFFHVHSLLQIKVSLFPPPAFFFDCARATKENWKFSLGIFLAEIELIYIYIYTCIYLDIHKELKKRKISEKGSTPVCISHCLSQSCWMQSSILSEAKLSSSQISHPRGGRKQFSHLFTELWCLGTQKWLEKRAATLQLFSSASRPKGRSTGYSYRHGRKTAGDLKGRKFCCYSPAVENSDTTFRELILQEKVPAGVFWWDSEKQPCSSVLVSTPHAVSQLWHRSSWGDTTRRSHTNDPSHTTYSICMSLQWD